MKSFFALFLAVVLGALGAHAQNCTVTGTVRDGLSGDPLVGAYVRAGDLFAATDIDGRYEICLLYTSPSPRDLSTSRMPSSA